MQDISTVSVLYSLLMRNLPNLILIPTFLTYWPLFIFFGSVCALIIAPESKFGRSFAVCPSISGFPLLSSSCAQA
jgi:hypothetical protein